VDASEERGWPLAGLSQEKLSSALNKRTAWFLFSLAFVAVYREVFETVLFFAALWTEGNGWPLLAGLGTGIGILALLAIVLLRTSTRLPIGQFFAASSLLVAVLAVILAGKGIAGLQEAGLIHTSLLQFHALTFWASIHRGRHSQYSLLFYSSLWWPSRSICVRRVK
jgi:FTR1 family protein